MFLKAVMIREFRGIRRMDALWLRKFNVIIGRNNSGKTAILEALFLFPVPFDSYVVPWYPRSRIGMIAEFHSGVGSLVYGYSGSAEVAYEVEIGSRILGITFILDTHAAVDVRMDGREVVLNEYLDELSSSLGLSRDDLFAFSFYLASRTGFIYKLHEFLCRDDVWNTIVKLGANTRLVRGFVSGAVRDRFTEILLGPKKRLMLRKEFSDGNVMYIDVADLGSGVERTLLVALALEYLSPKIVLIDDVEQSAHPGLLKAFIEWLADKDWQVVLTTHSIDVLSALVELDVKDFQLIALNKDPDDVVNFRVYELSELEDALASGIDLRRMLDLV